MQYGSRIALYPEIGSTSPLRPDAGYSFENRAGAFARSAVCTGIALPSSAFHSAVGTPDKLLSVAIVGITLAAAAAASAGVPEGRWLTEERTGIVEVYRCDGGLCGRLLSFDRAALRDNPQARDIHNPEPDLRSRSLCGLPVLWGFRPDGRDHWGGGSAYDPKSGHTYSGEITLTPAGSLSLRGYIGVPLFGRSETWTPYTRPVPRCPPD